MKQQIYGKENQELNINKQLNRGCYARRKSECKFKVWLLFGLFLFF